MGIKSLFKQIKDKFNSGGQQEYQEECVQKYLMSELAPNIKSEKDWDFLNSEAKKQEKYLNDETRFLVTELRKQYLIATLGKEDPRPNMKAIISDTKMSIANYKKNMELRAKGLPVKNDIMNEDDKFLSAMINKELNQLSNRKNISTLEEANKLIFDDGIRKEVQQKIYFKFMRPNQQNEGR